MTEDQINYMIDRFLGWKLPGDFNPDAGISFKAAFNEHTAHPMKHEPSGTNLFDAMQAKAMIQYMLEGLPASGTDSAAFDNLGDQSVTPTNPAPQPEAQHPYIENTQSLEEWCEKNPRQAASEIIRLDAEVRGSQPDAQGEPALPRNRKPAFWTHDAEAVKKIGEHLYYFAPTNRTPPPYKTQRHVTAIIDIAADGTLAGVELIDNMPPPPVSRPSQGGEAGEEAEEALASLPASETAPYPRSARDAFGRRVDAAPMPEALKDTIATCYGLLWEVTTDSKRIHRARAGLLQWLTKDEQSRGIENARAVALMVGLPASGTDSGDGNGKPSVGAQTEGVATVNSGAREPVPNPAPQPEAQGEPVAWLITYSDGSTEATCDHDRARYHREFLSTKIEPMAVIRPSQGGEAREDHLPTWHDVRGIIPLPIPPDSACQGSEARELRAAIEAEIKLLESSYPRSFFEKSLHGDALLWQRLTAALKSAPPAPVQPAGGTDGSSRAPKGSS